MKKLLLALLFLFFHSSQIFSEEKWKNDFINKGLFCFNKKEDGKRDAVGLWFLKDNIYETHSVKNIEDFKYMREFVIDTTIFYPYGYSVSNDTINLYIKNVGIFGTINRYNAEYYNDRDEILRKCEFYKNRDLMLNQLWNLVEKRKVEFQNKLKKRKF